MTMHQPPLISRSRWQPATFIERGVTVPFTTPLVAMARLRPADGRMPELIVANPSGAGGSYVFPLRALPDFTTPSMHDRLLLELLLALPAVSPGEIRRAVRSAAETGAAGREAAKSARMAAEREEHEQILTNLLLITTLLQQAGFADVDWRRLNLADRTTRATTREYLSRHEAALGMKPDAMLALVEELSAVVAPVGVVAAGFKSAHEVTIERLEALIESLRDWGKGEALDQAKGVELIARCAEFTLVKARDGLGRARHRTEDAVTLLVAWRDRDRALLRELTLADWLLDGWSEITALWASVENEDRDTQRVMLARIESLVPVMPKEALAADDGEGGPQRQLTQRRWVRLNEDWRSGALMLDEAARVEQAKGLAA
jgi:hypothetical protein